MEPSLLLSFLPLIIMTAIAGIIAYGIKKVADKYPPAAQAPSHVSGIGGWLLLLILGLVFLGPLMGAVGLHSEFSSLEEQHPNIETVAEWKTFKIAAWSIFVSAYGLGIYAANGLIKIRNMSAVTRAQITLWIIGPIANFVLETLLPLAIFGKTQSSYQPSSNLVVSIIMAAIWTVYLSKSKRVRATYGNSI